MTKELLEQKLTELCKKDIAACTYEELYTALLTIVDTESQ